MKPPIIKGDPEKNKSTVAPTSLSTNSGIANANASDKDKAIPYYENTDYLIKNKIGRTGYWNEFQKYAQNYTLPSGEKFIQNEQANKGTTNEFSDKLLQSYRDNLIKKFGEGNPNIEKMAITPDDIKQVQTYYNQGNPNLKIDGRIGGETSQLRYPILTKADVKVPEGSFAPVLYGKKQYLSSADKYNSGDITNNLIEYNPSYDSKIDPNALKAIGNYTTQATNPIQQKASGGKIMPPKRVKGYFNGTPPGGVEGEYNPDKPISGQGIIQPNGAAFTPTGNATNNQGQQSSQVNQGDKNKVSKGDLFSKDNISGVIGAGTALAASLSANKQLRGEQKRKADVGAVNSTVDSVASMVPVYGQVYAGAKAASGIAKSALPTDANGNVVGQENEQLNRVFTPLHETVINDLSKGNTGDALLNTLSLGVYGMHKDYFSYDDRQKQKEADKQTKLDEFRKINAESKGKQAMAARDSGDFGAQAKDVYDINSAKFDNAGNFQSINPTGYKGGGLVGKIKQMCAEGGSIKPTITNDKVMEVAMSGKGYDTLNKYDKQRVDSMKQHMSSQGNKDMMSFPKMIQGKADGGEIEGKGTGKSDSIHAKVEEGSFVVPAENADLAKGVRKLLLKAPNKKANVNQKEGEEVKLSNGEHLFTPEENEYLESIGVNLEALAPNAEKKEDGKAKGGPIDATKEKNRILNEQNAKRQAEIDKFYADKDASQQNVSRNKAKQENLDKANAVETSSKALEYSKKQYDDFIKNAKVGGVLGYTQENYDAERVKRLSKIEDSQNALKQAVSVYKPNAVNVNNQTKASANKEAVNNSTVSKDTNKSGEVVPKQGATPIVSSGLRAPKVNKSQANAYTPPKVVDNGTSDEVVVPGDKLSPNERANLTASENKTNADAKALNASLPQTLPTTYANNNKRKGSGILNALGNIDPTMAIGPMQTAMGINMLQGSTRPIDKAVLDATYNGNVNRAQGQAGYGYSPEQMAMLQNENQNSLNDARFSARNFAGGNASTAFNQERQAINQGWANKLGLTSADQQLRMQKQQYADEQVANRASILSANRRQAYTDALGAFQQKQQAGSELVGAGLQNTIGAYRYNKELSNENKADVERNRWTSEIGKTNV